VLSDKSPVIVVMNKADIRTKSIDKTRYQSIFPDIVDFYEVSCKSGVGIDILRDVITKQLTHLPQVNELLPFTWKFVRDSLENLSENMDFITRNKYYERYCYRKFFQRFLEPSIQL
jgi:internalin A